MEVSSVKNFRQIARKDGTGMAALPYLTRSPPFSTMTASHHNQMTSSNSLAGGSAFNDSLLVPKRQDVLKVVYAAQSAKRKGSRRGAFRKHNMEQPVPSALAWLILGMAGIFLYVVLSLGF
jgi:hypothetical protein